MFLRSLVLYAPICDPLNLKQEQHCARVCKDLHQQFQGIQHSLTQNRNITCDESCVYGHDPDTIRFVYSREPSVSTTEEDASVMCSGTVILSPRFRPFKVENYCDILRHLKENIWRKTPELWCDGDWVLEHVGDALQHINTVKMQELSTASTAIVTYHHLYLVCGL